MAIGLGALFGIRLPLNFNSPYKASSIRDFWRRWHITLSRFLRDYLYIPLGGGRTGPVRQGVNLMITMLLGGLWHGAGWTFVLWGGLHGVYLVIDKAWRGLLRGWGRSGAASSRLYRTAATGLTFTAVVFGWVLFRAETLEAAGSIAGAMVGMQGVTLPSAYAWAVESHPFLAGLVERLGVGYEPMPLFFGKTEVAILAALLGAVFFLPNTQQLFHAFRPAYETYRGEVERPPGYRRLGWRPRPLWAVAVMLLWIVSFMMMSSVSPFLYYQF
jgi:hypothetical protein